MKYALTKRTAVAGLVALVLAGCGADQGSAAPGATESTTAAVSPEVDVPGEAVVDLEGSVTTEDGSFVQYPDGMKVTIASVKVAPAAEYGMGEAQPGDVAVAVTEHVENVGPDPVPLNTQGTGTFKGVLFYGENYTQAIEYAYTGVTQTLPQRLVPGTSVDWTTAHLVPEDGLGVLRFTVNPNTEAYQDYTFTDVETLLP